MAQSGLHRYAIFTVCSTVFLIAAGGLVTSTGSGLSVPDWPLSYGSLNPPMIGGIRFEHSHRLIAGFVGFLTLGLAVWVWLKETRGWVKAFAAATLGAVVLQAVLGGITVLYYLPTWVSASHACIAQSFLCLVGSLAYFTSREWRERSLCEFDRSNSLRRLTVVTVLFVFAQLVAGALLRHGVEAALAYHFAGAFLVALHVLFITSRISRAGDAAAPFLRQAATIGLMVIVQVFLGFGALIYTRLLAQRLVAPGSEVFFATAHQTLGALIFLGTVLLALRVHRRTEYVRSTAAPVAGSVR